MTRFVEIATWIVLLLGPIGWVLNVYGVIRGSGDWLNWVLVILMPISFGMLLWMYLRFKRGAATR